MKKLFILCFLGICSGFAFSQNYNWAQKFEGIDSTCRIYASTLDANGNIYVTGVVTNTLDFDPGNNVLNLSGVTGKSSFFLAKYTTNGGLVWAQSMGTNYNVGEAAGHSIVLDSVGNIFVAGIFDGGVDFDPGIGELTASSSGSFNNVFLARYTNAGSVSWVYDVANMQTSQIGDIKNVVVRLDPQGWPLVMTCFTGTIGVGFNYKTTSPYNVYNISLAKYAPWDGFYQWSNKLESTNSIMGRDLQCDASGNIFITGEFVGSADFDPSVSTVNLSSATNTREDLFIAKYDANFNYSWVHTMGGPGYDNAYALDVDASNNIYVTGLISGAVDMDPGPGTVTLNGNAISTYIVKFDNGGNYTWAKGIDGGTNTNFGRALQLDAYGNIYIAGFFSGAADFDPGAPVYNLNSSGTSDLYFAEYTSAGNFVSAKSIGGINSVPDQNFSTTNLMLDASGGIFMTGAFKGTLDFDPGAATANLSSSASYANSIFMAKYAAVTIPTGISEIKNSSASLNVYPNPFKGQGYLSLKLKNTAQTQISVFNSSGALVNTLENTQLNAGDYLYELKLKENGVYFLRIEADGVSETKKVIVIN